jgi:hypothetical protein
MTSLTLRSAWICPPTAGRLHIVAKQEPRRTTKHMQQHLSACSSCSPKPTHGILEAGLSNHTSKGELDEHLNAPQKKHLYGDPAILHISPTAEQDKAIQ